MNKIWKLCECIIKAIMSMILKVLKKSWNEEQWDDFFQFLKFGLVGLSNTVISYVTYAVLIYIGMQYLIANTTAFIISVLNSYYWNNKYVFVAQEGEKRHPLKTLFKTVIAYASTGLILNSVLLIVWVDILHISPYVGPIINLLVTIPLNFVINKFWAYKGK